MKPVQVLHLKLLPCFDFPGMITIFSALLCYFLSMEWGGITKPWNSADVVGTLIATILLTALFIFNACKKNGPS